MTQSTQAKKSLNKMDEEIVVVANKDLESILEKNSLFIPTQSFDKIEQIIQKNKKFIKRGLAETDNTLKQIIPYFIFKHNSKYFLMQRADNAGESRLKNKKTLGIGGHLREKDVAGLPLSEWGMREFHEEVSYNGNAVLSPLGIINDNRNSVGEVHLGIVFLIEGTSGDIKIKSELKNGYLHSLEEIIQDFDSLEGWSQLVVEYLQKKSLVQGARKMQPTTSPELTTKLSTHALQLRIDSMRATTASKSGHPTSCLSAADIIAALFFHTMKFDVADPKNLSNDRFIMSKGHAIPVVYAAYKQLGVISDKELLSLRHVDSFLEGHPTPRFAYNEAATGSLGQGLSIGIGMALQARLNNFYFKTFVMLGDGEIAEGSVWEAAEFAGYNNLENLIAIVDCNRLGQSDHTIAQHDVEKIAQKFKAFGWHTITIDGHSMPTILDALAEATGNHGSPTAIIAKTIKGYGIENTENKIGFHGKPFSDSELQNAIDTIKKRFSSSSAQLNTIQSNKIVSNPTSTKHSNIILSIEKSPNATLFGQGKSMAPRKAYGYALADLGSTDTSITVVDADVKNSTFADIFEQAHPERFIQSFIAEQNMIGIATGLTLRGQNTFCATFGAFFTRAHDQIRMAGIGKVPLKLCGSHCGVSIGEDGPSQMALEDIAMMRCIPHSIVLYPSDAVSAYALTVAMANYAEGISFLRTTRESLPILYDVSEKFVIGGCKILKQSSSDQLCIIGAGITLHEALKAHKELQTEGINASIIDLYSVKPIDTATIRNVAKKSYGKVLTVEDHYKEGGIGEAIAAALKNDGFSIESLAVDEISRSGKSAELLALARIDAAHIIAAARKMAEK